MSEKQEAPEAKPEQEAAPPAAEPVRVPANPPAQVPAPQPQAPGDDVKEAAEALLAQVPEQLRGLIPDVSPAEKIRWFKKAQESGALAQRPNVPTTDTSRPKSTVPEPDLSKLPPIARMSRAYGKQ